MTERRSASRICKRCVTVFLARPSEVRRGRALYCSETCARRKTGAESNGWKGGLTLSSCGYWCVYAPDHPHAVNGYAKRATLVLEDKIGRYLERGEIAHHVNGNRQDDIPENLEPMTVEQHNEHHGALTRKPRLRFPDHPVNRRYNWPSSDQLLRMRASMTLREMAVVLGGCSIVSVHRHLKKLARNDVR